MTMLEALAARGRAAEIPEEMDVYGWLVGEWELDVIRYGVDVRDRGIKGRALFGRVLEGRAIQDVWIMHVENLVSTYGTTLRIWDPAIRAWRVTWVNPISGRRNELVGTRVDQDIVQIGRHADGTPIRWRFIETTNDSFRWLGEALERDGNSWKLESEFHGRRIS
ncbi:MAG TPA: hypothetical protein VHW00_08995 [Thermoanaerobaculia bacterium]|nr:hypothetical protein [Thermoanaerobaculia bacterium]